MLTHAVGAIPARLFDTQVAAGFVGYGTPSLSSLLQGELGITPAKGDRLTDWLRRPLTDAQRTYAAADVASLLELHDRLVAELDGARPAGLGRGGVRGAAHPADRGDRPGAGLDQAEGRPVAASQVARPSPRPWRRGGSERPRRSDMPVRQVLPDLAILGISQRQPTTLEELAQARGVDERHRRGRIGPGDPRRRRRRQGEPSRRPSPTPSTSSTAPSARP